MLDPAASIIPKIQNDRFHDKLEDCNLRLDLNRIIIMIIDDIIIVTVIILTLGRPSLLHIID